MWLSKKERGGRFFPCLMHLSERGGGTFGRVTGLVCRLRGLFYDSLFYIPTSSFIEIRCLIDCLISTKFEARGTFCFVRAFYWNSVFE